MGYSMYSLFDGVFFLAKENHASALEAIKRLNSLKMKTGPWNQHFAFVDSSRYQQAATLSDALQAWRWLPMEDEQGNIESLEFLGEKYGDEDVLFAAIAPFVREGSAIRVVGEDGIIWRWFFSGGRVQRQEGRVVFPPASEAETPTGT